jgi:hypothetical protein
MECVEDCTGPLLWFPVNDGGDCAALVYCDGCGEVFAWLLAPVDDRHANLPLLVG